MTRSSAHRTLASESRMRILHLLQERDREVTVDEVADAVGLHVSTAREHLDRLIGTGFVGRTAERRTSRGRPRVLYRALPRAAAASMDPHVREELQRVLLESYGAMPDAVQPHPVQPDAVQPDAVLHQLVALEQHFEDLGLDPTADVERRQVRLRRCPVRELARMRVDAVCAVHLQLARGVLAHVQGPLEADRIEPSADDGHCVLHLVAR